MCGFQSRDTPSNATAALECYRYLGGAYQGPGCVPRDRRCRWSLYGWGFFQPQGGVANMTRNMPTFTFQSQSHSWKPRVVRMICAGVER